MPAIKNITTEVRFKTTEDIKKRLAHHAKRIGADMNDIVRQGTLDYLDRLDEQEALALERKRLRERKGAFVPTPPKHRWGDVPGLGKQKETTAPFKLPTLTFLSKTEIKEPPEKVTKAFRRWSEYIEEAEDRSDGERRAQVVLDDIYEKCTTDEEKQISYDAFKEFLAQRKEAKEKPESVVDVGDVTVAGDLD